MEKKIGIFYVYAVLFLLLFVTVTSIAEVEVGEFWSLIDDDTLHTNNESWNMSIGKNATTTDKLFVNGSTTLDGTLTIGENDEGHNIRFYGDTDGKFMDWVAGINQLTVLDRFIVSTAPSSLPNPSVRFDVPFTVGTKDAKQEISFFGNLNLTDNLTFGSQRIYNDSNNLYINNSVNNKDIIFQINDSGIFKDFMKIDTSTPSLLIDAGTFEGSVATPVFYVKGDTAPGIVGIAMRFDITNDGSGTAFITYGQPIVNRKLGGSIIGHYLRASGIAGSGGTHNKVGFEADMDFPATPTGAVTYRDTGFDADMGTIISLPLTSTGANYFQRGMIIQRNSHIITNGLGGDINNLNSYGLKITGWGSVDTVTGVSGTINNYAIHSDGGDTYYGDGQHDFVGNVNVTENITGNIHYAEMWMHNDVSPNITVLEDALIWYNTTAFNQPDNGTSLNGFTYSNSNLTCLISGKYKVAFSITHSGTANNKYHFAIGINGQPQFNTETHERMSNVNDITSCSGSGFLDLTVNDKVSLQVMNEDGGNDATIYSVNVNLIRIGDI